MIRCKGCGCDLPLGRSTWCSTECYDGHRSRGRPVPPAYPMPPRQELAQSYEEALALGFDPLEAAALETDLLLAREDSSQLPDIAPVVAAEAGKIPAHSKDWGRDACDVRPRGNEGVASMQGDSISREAADASPQEQFERAA